MTAQRCALLLLLLCSICAQPIVVKRWPLVTSLPDDDLSVDGSAAGPAGAVFCSALERSGNSNTARCHQGRFNTTCNVCVSRAPHVFHVTWCADTRGYAGMTCSLDLGYRSPEGPRYGLLQYAVRGTGSSGADWTNESSVIFPDSPYAFSHFAGASGANTINTVFQLQMAEGNFAGDNMPLTASEGFCCRATFSGGNTVTGTFFLGDLDIRADARVAPSGAPGYSGGALGGGLVGGAALGAAVGLGGIALFQYRATGALPALLSPAAWRR
jgi:hypothetical protein